MLGGWLQLRFWNTEVKFFILTDISSGAPTFVHPIIPSQGKKYDIYITTKSKYFIIFPLQKHLYYYSVAKLLTLQE
jgi:hypothetical protein